MSVRMNAELLFERVHPAGLALTRILFGFLMLFDIPEERGGSEIDFRWGDPRTCYFPLVSFIKRLPFEWMCVLYGVMWLGALGTFLGYKFRASIMAFILSYWYILLLDKSFWNNHSYLYGLIAIVLSTSGAGKYWSLDSYIKFKQTGECIKDVKQDGVPFWNYFLLRFQLFCLYFMAGLKKLDTEWIEGYSMTNLGEHWVFNPFGIILTTEQIDYLVVHMVGLLLDLTLGFLLLYHKTRPFAYLFGGAFHIMNSRLFTIGMFPYMCLATFPIFSSPDWPLSLYNSIKNVLLKTICRKQNGDSSEIKQNGNNNVVKPVSCKPETNDQGQDIQITLRTKRDHFKLLLIVLYCLVQLFLPWSHFITKGYNNWTNGLYGYSWDMMVHSWDTTIVIIRLVDHDSGEEIFLDPEAWVPNDRWTKHADMTMQYAECIRRNYVSVKTDMYNDERMGKYRVKEVPVNISVYVDTWCSLNGRFQQRMFDPHYDLLNANWSPFNSVEWLMPILYEYSDFREKMKSIQGEIYARSEYTDVFFAADFPGMTLHNYISKDLENVTLQIIEGEVTFESDHENKTLAMKKGDSTKIVSKIFHHVTTISDTPSCYMYTFENKTASLPGSNDAQSQNKKDARYWSPSPLPLLENQAQTWDSMISMFAFFNNAVLYILYDVPMPRRVKVIAQDKEEEW